MQRNLASLQNETFDLLVIGGGIFGACAARDAVQRGLSVALIERRDFCSASSANSYKLLHGGIRYLQHGDVIRARESARARRAFLRVAPHLCRPLPMVIPTYGHGMKGKEILRAGMAAYDVITFDRNRGVRAPERHVPRGFTLGRSELLERYPGLSTKGLTGAAVFSDGQMYNPTRLVLAFVQDAVKEGACAANYVKANRFLVAGNRVEGVVAEDCVAGGEFEIRARSVLNAAGPYAEGLLESSLGKPLTPATPWSRDAYFVVGRPLIGGTDALALPAQTADPEALMSRGARHLFLVPWHGFTLAGVWHKVYKGHPDEYDVTEQELTEFASEINGAYEGLDVGLDDISLWNAGLIPFGENDAESGDLKFAHRSRMVDHAKEGGPAGLHTLIGVRFTTGPCEAVEAVDSVFKSLGRKAPSSRADQTPVYGGDLDSVDAHRSGLRASAPSAIPDTSLDALAHNHGSEVGRVFALASERPELAQPLPDSIVIGAEVVQAVREEMVHCLSDVVLRRTDLGTAGHPGAAALQACAELVGDELGWDEARRKQEIETVDASFPLPPRA